MDDGINVQQLRFPVFYAARPRAGRYATLEVQGVRTDSAANRS